MDVSTVDLTTPFKDMFVADQQSIKFYGNLVFSDGKKMVTSVKLTENKGRMLFAKGFDSINQIQDYIKA